MNHYPIPLTLHIGYPRTATTLLQKQLDESNDHILYLGRVGTGYDPSDWYTDNFYYYWEWLRLGKIEIDIEEAREHIGKALLWGEENHKEAAVISDETICKPHYNSYYHDFSLRLKELFPQANILLTIRNQVDLIFSTYGLTLRALITKNNPAQTFDYWFLNGAGSNYVPVAERYNYAKLYSALLEHFDAHKIKILFYEDLVHDTKKYLHDLKSAVEADKIHLNVNDRVNTSPRKNTFSPLGRHIISKGGGLYNFKYIRRYPELIDLFYSKVLMRKIDWDDYGKSDERIRFICSLFYKSNDNFSKMANVDLDTHGYPTTQKMEKDYKFYMNKLYENK